MCLGYAVRGAVRGDRHVFSQRRTFALGCTNVAYGVGIFLGPLVGQRLASGFHSWRVPFVLLGTSGLAIAMIALFVVSHRLTEPWRRPGRRDHCRRRITTAAVVRPPVRTGNEPGRFGSVRSLGEPEGVVGPPPAGWRFA